MGENLLWGYYLQNVAKHDLMQVSHTLFTQTLRQISDEFAE
ncbi:MAG: hypothetical protein CM15mP116_11300 [Synechococcus sp.]|nr:MAG: hypothetical protein CM15mP116_11300 [Synechococcus sp.]